MIQNDLHFYTALRSSTTRKNVFARFCVIYRKLLYFIEMGVGVHEREDETER